MYDFRTGECVLNCSINNVRIWFVSNFIILFARRKLYTLSGNVNFLLNFGTIQIIIDMIRSMTDIMQYQELSPNKEFFMKYRELYVRLSAMTWNNEVGVKTRPIAGTDGKTCVKASVTRLELVNCPQWATFIVDTERTF